MKRSKVKVNNSTTLLPTKEDVLKAVETARSELVNQLEDAKHKREMIEG